MIKLTYDGFIFTFVRNCLIVVNPFGERWKLTLDPYESPPFHIQRMDQDTRRETADRLNRREEGEV